MVRARATNYGGNRAGGRVRAKVTSPRSRPRKIVSSTHFGRGMCPVCREMKPLLSGGKLRGHTMYGVSCLGSHSSPTVIEGA